MIDYAAVPGDVEPKEGLDALADAAKKNEEKKRDESCDALTKQFRPIGIDWLNTAPPPRQYLLEHEQYGQGFMPMGRVAMMCGSGGSGKSFAAISLALSVANGANSKWFDTYRVKQGGKVLILMAEEDPGELRRRVYYCAKSNEHLNSKAVASNLHAVGMAGYDVSFILGDAEMQQRSHGNAYTSSFFRHCEDLLSKPIPDWSDGWTLIIIDPASRFGGPEFETNSAFATKAIQHLEALTKVQGNPAVLFLHHANKASSGERVTDQNNARGMSAITDGCRLQINVTKRRRISGAPRLVDIGTAKSNYSEGGDMLTLAFGEHGVLHKAKKGEITDYENAAQKANASRPREPKASAIAQREEHNNDNDGSARSLLG